ncbi:HAD-IA family hydrolase [Candidatus Saccharibacteria bacterium]|nr:HAD-IA family hydrolase [Candidatus Saccharibacteria bacterium]
MIKAIIFDCFGVVVNDTMPAAYASLGGDFEKDKSAINAAIDAANKGLIPRSTGPIAELLGVSEETWISAIAAGREKNESLLEYILELRKTYKVGMLSNIGKGGFERLFEDGFLEQYFDAAIESSALGFAKPEPEAYETVADQLGVRLDECVFTDDRQVYIDGATAVGMKAILFKDTEQFKADLQEFLR